MTDITTHGAPLACLLLEAELAERRENVIHELFRVVQQTRELTDGYAFAFPGEAEWLTRLAEFIAFERACCPFFTFELICEPNAGPVWLHLRGPEGVKEMVRFIPLARRPPAAWRRRPALQGRRRSGLPG